MSGSPAAQKEGRRSRIPSLRFRIGKGAFVVPPLIVVLLLLLGPVVLLSLYSLNMRSNIPGVPTAYSGTNWKDFLTGSGNPFRARFFYSMKITLLVSLAATAIGGMLAAETAFEALKKNDFSAATLSDFQRRVESSWIKDELWKVRNFHQGFERGFWMGMLNAGLQQITGGRGLRNRARSTPGYMHMKRLAELPADGGAEGSLQHVDPLLVRVRMGLRAGSGRHAHQPDDHAVALDAGAIGGRIIRAAEDVDHFGKIE